MYPYRTQVSGAACSHHHRCPLISLAFSRSKRESGNLSTLTKHNGFGFSLVVVPIITRQAPSSSSGPNGADTGLHQFLVSSLILFLLFFGFLGGL
ncbi:hypothetical protein BDR04DRAFT_146754 [Suillus decipiens]|nr:hypothetical protein BDR04DRAFT_146754 [Suillus decipiens]